ncbi:MAG TPA: hypothetical protein PKI19_07215 [Elusimicrobiales bacterium]|nr:hypothetical protein [Elusimicrobiales bacterium]
MTTATPHAAAGPDSAACKTEYVRWCAVLSLSALVCGAVLYCIDANYTPDLDGILAYARSVSAAQTGLLPEPKEKLLFLSALLTLSLCLPALYYLSGKCCARLKAGVLAVLYPPAVAGSAALVIFLTYKGLRAANPFAENAQNAQDLIARTNLDFYFAGTFLHGHFYWFAGLLYPALLFCFLYAPKLPDAARAALEKFKNGAVHAVCGAIIAAVFAISVFKFPYTFENKYDFNAVYYSVVQVANGLPMLVDGFTNTYGLYPHFVAPLMKIFGSGVLSFSALMAVLSSLCFIFIFLFLKKNITSRALVLFGFTTVFFNSYLYLRIANSYDSHFAMCPIRWLFPSLLLFFSNLYLENRSRKAYFLSYPLFALGVLWNPDYGTVSYLSLTAFYSYLEFNGQGTKSIFRKICGHLAVSLVFLAAAFAAYSAAIRIFYGSFPELLKMFSTIQIFSVVGSGMLPMPAAYHPWMLTAALYMTGLLYSFRHAVNRTVSPRPAVVFLLTVLGIGIFAYYQGRSHNWNLFASNFMPFLLLTIFAEDLLKLAKKEKTFALPFALATFFLSFSLFQTVYGAKKTGALFFEKANKEANKTEQAAILANAALIKSLTVEKERILIFTRIWYQGLYHGLSKTAAAVNPGLMDLFFKTDYERLLSFMAASDRVKIFFEPEYFGLFDNKVPLLLSALYDPQDTGRGGAKIMYFLKKKGNNSGSYYFKHDGKAVVHELFDRDLANKLSYARGEKGGIALGRQFSIEVIFRPAGVQAPPFTDWATVYSNTGARGGFVLQQHGGVQTQYIFGFGKSGIICPVTPGKWNYLAFGVSGNRILAYAGGRYLGELAVPDEYKNSGEPLYLGSLKTLGGFFFGDIRELKISNSPLDPGEVAAAWTKTAKLPG